MAASCCANGYAKRAFFCPIQLSNSHVLFVIPGRAHLSSLSFRGASETSEPGIHAPKNSEYEMDSGSAPEPVIGLAEARPGGGIPE